MSKGFGRTFGQDIMRGEYVVGSGGGKVSTTGVSQKLAPGGGGGGAWPAEPRTESSEAFGNTSTEGSGTSIFDPVLCELMYKWFCPSGGQIIDPFAGGSVRGIVASLLGYRYWGCDLRAEQISANNAQRGICKDAPNQPVWITGDSRETLPVAPQADFIFSCPPYGDLERYSDDPKDLSTMSYHAFLAAYKQVLEAAAARLKSNRYLCLVVGDFRDPKTGNYRGFVADTILICRELLKLPLYNEAILVTAIGSLPVRVGKQFEAGRKLGKTHQNVLVFVKGDGKKAAQACRTPTGGQDAEGERVQAVAPDSDPGTEGSVESEAPWPAEGKTDLFDHIPLPDDAE